jgi:hypothetical protein
MQEFIAGYWWLLVIGIVAVVVAMVLRRFRK